MRIIETASHRGAREKLDALGLTEQIRSSINASHVVIGKGCSPQVKRQITSALLDFGWACPVKIVPGLGPDLNALHPNGVVLQIQIGNIARAFYDLMKMQSLYDQERASCGVLVLPTNIAARSIGSNLANFGRVHEELEGMFSQQIQVPVLTIGFE